MSSGGARNRSGPQPDEHSANSDRRGYSLEFLPSEGYADDPPPFPLPDPTDRELEVWVEAWRTPQACAWSRPDQHWRWRTVALWVRTSVRCEARDVASSTLSQLHRFGDQIGMTTAGLSEMGWKIAPPVRARTSAESEADDPASNVVEIQPRRLSS